MPLSTSSSRVPDGPWRNTLMLTGVLFLLVLAGTELSWRHMGYTAESFTDDERLWALQRELLGTGDTSDTVVLLGTSRMQLGFSATAFDRALPNRRLIRLDILAAAPFATLRDLAQEENFTGTVLVDVTVGSLRGQRYQDQQPYVDFYHKEWNLNHRLNRDIQTFLERHLVLMDQRLNPKDFLRGLRDRAEMPYIMIGEDRSHRADYNLIPERAMAQLKHRSKKPTKLKQDFSETDKQRWLRRVMRVEPYVEAIQNRGGRVVFVHLPLSEQVWQWHKPKKAAYWDLFAETTTAATLHFADHPQLQFDTPDGSHLDYRDAEVFTTNLLNILTAQKIIRKSFP